MSGNDRRIRKAVRLHITASIIAYNYAEYKLVPPEKVMSIFYNVLRLILCKYTKLYFVLMSCTLVAVSVAI